jgi:mannosyltransferase
MQRNMISNKRDSKRLLIFTLYALPIMGTMLSSVNGWVPYSYWLDELYSITVSSLGFSDMFDAVLIDVHPPLYQVLLWFWIRLLSDYEPIARAFSFICTLSAVAYLYLWSKRLDPWARVLTIIFFSTSWLFIYYAQEARSYALLLLFSTLLIGLFLNDDGSKKNFWQMLCVAILLASTHYFGLILVGSILCWLFFQNIKSTARLGLLCVVVLAIFFWPIFQYFEGALGSKAGGRFWIQIDGPLGTLAVFIQAIAPVLRTWGERLNIILTVSCAGILVSLLAFRFRRAYSCQNIVEQTVILKLLFCLLWTLVAIVIIDLHTPISTERNYVVLLPIVSILFGLGLGALAEIRLANILILLVTLVWGQMQLDYAHRLLSAKWTPLQNWKACAEYLVHDSSGQQLYYLPIVDSAEMNRVFNYYIKRISNGTMKADSIDLGRLQQISKPTRIFVGGLTPDAIDELLTKGKISPTAMFYPVQNWQNSTAILRVDPMRMD